LRARDRRHCRRCLRIYMTTAGVAEAVIHALNGSFIDPFDAPMAPEMVVVVKSAARTLTASRQGSKRLAGISTPLSARLNASASPYRTDAFNSYGGNAGSGCPRGNLPFGLRVDAS
jgi:hypothetical protein